MGEFVAFGVYLAMLVWPMIALGWAFNLVQRGAASMGRINQLFRERPAITSPAVPRRAAPAKGARAVEFRGVWFSYPGARERGWVLQDISLPGRARIVARHRGPDRLGQVHPGGPDRPRPTTRPGRRADRWGRPAPALARRPAEARSGFVPQETFLFGESLRRNILLGAPDDGRLERVAEIASSPRRSRRCPMATTPCWASGGSISQAGRSSAAAIARALAQDPPVFVLDDALSAVDAQTEARILAGLRDALAGRTSIIVSHRLAAVRDADWILVLDGGRIVEQGTHAELLRGGGRYWELLRRQQMEEELEEESVGGG